MQNVNFDSVEELLEFKLLEEERVSLEETINAVKKTVKETGL